MDRQPFPRQLQLESKSPYQPGAITLASSQLAANLPVGAASAILLLCLLPSQRGPNLRWRQVAYMRVPCQLVGNWRAGAMTGSAS